MSSLTAGAVTGGNTEIDPILNGQLSYTLKPQSSLSRNCCWDQRKWLFGETFSPLYVVFWSHDRMKLFLIFLFPWGRKEGGQINLSKCPHFLLPSGPLSWAIWPVSRRISWASKSKLAMTFKHFSHRLPAEKLFVQFILLPSAYIFLYLSLCDYNRLCRECFFVAIAQKIDKLQ